MSYFINYNECLDTLFEQWINSYPEADRNKFCRDGIMRKVDDSINVDELWENSSRRVMLMVKDCPDGYGYDTRDSMKMNKDVVSDLEGKFYPWLAMLLYGILENRIERRVGDRDIVSKMEEGVVKKVWNTQPFAFIETKKLAGGEDCPPNILREALERDEVFLKKEIDILSPNVIVCCDGNGTMFDFITQENFLGESDYPLDYRYPLQNRVETKWHCRLRYYKQRRMVVIESFHPSYPGLEKWAFLERVMSPFAKFLNECKPQGF